MTFTSRTKIRNLKIWSPYNVGNGLYRVSESLLLRKGHFLSRKRGRLFKKYFFRSLNWALKPRKKGTFLTFKKSGGGGAHAPIAPPPGSAAPEVSSVRLTCMQLIATFAVPLPSEIHDSGLI